MKDKRVAGKKNQRGFTLIELMIVIAILGILASIAISSYQDYSVRARVSEASAIVAPITTAIGTYYWTNSSFPSSMNELGHGNVVTRYIDGVTITSNRWISININEDTTGVATAAPGVDMFIIYKPRLATGAIRWECAVNDLADGSGNNTTIISRFVPGNCRN